jgi:peptidoglycan hydrolase CwlO-like protein
MEASMKAKIKELVCENREKDAKISRLCQDNRDLKREVEILRKDLVANKKVFVNYVISLLICRLLFTAQLI